MKILKYIFLLILLAFFALTVFVATQKAIKALAPTLKEFNESQTYQRDTRASKLATEQMNRDATSVAIQNAKQDLYEKAMTSTNRINASNATYVRTEKDSKGTKKPARKTATKTTTKKVSTKAKKE